MSRSLKVSLVALSVATLALAGCGSSPKSSASSTTKKTAAALATTTTPAAATSTSGPPLGPPAPTTTAPPTTATSSTIAPIPVVDRSPAGKWGTAPTVTVPPGAPPTRLESADLIVGKGPAAEAGDAVTVEYVLATYSARKVIQSSWTSQPFSFTLGQGVIQGWSDGVVGMRVGGRRELIIPPSLGYGANSPGAGIGVNDTLVFVIDLQKIG